MNLDFKTKPDLKFEVVSMSFIVVICCILKTSAV